MSWRIHEKNKGAKGAPGDGLPGSPGISAYQVAVNNGFVGTEAAWLASLVGPEGDDGDAATVSVGTVSTGAAGSSATVTNVGTSSAVVLDFSIPQGNPGTNGTAATIAVGTVTTGAPSSSATVTNAGTSSAAVFNFTIPRGDTGTPGISKRIVVYTGTTDANGLFTVTHSPAFAATPAVVPDPPANANQVWVKVSSTASGFSYRLANRAVLSVLGLDVLAGGVTNAAGVTVRAVAIEA